MTKHADADSNKGALEQDRPSQPSNTSLRGQLPHRNANPIVKSADTDYPEPGENAEHSGEPETRSQLDRDAGCENTKRGSDPEGETQDQQPGHRQKRNQGGSEDDPLAA